MKREGGRKDSGSERGRESNIISAKLIYSLCYTKKLTYNIAVTFGEIDFFNRITKFNSGSHPRLIFCIYHMVIMIGQCTGFIERQ